MPTALKKISELDPSDTLEGSEQLPAVQSGASVKTTINDLLAFVPTNGLILTYVSTTSFSMGTGSTSDSTHVAFMKLLTTITKTTSTWVAGTAQGGLDTGTIATSTWYYVYVIKNLTTGVVDWLYSASATAPTMPSGYTVKRMVGAVKTNSSSQFIQWIMYEDGTQQWVTPFSDIVDTTMTTSKKTYVSTSIPNVKSRVNWYFIMASATIGVAIYIYGDTNLTDYAPGSNPPTSIPSSQVSGLAVYAWGQVIHTGNSLYARASAASTSMNAFARDYNIRPFN